MNINGRQAARPDRRPKKRARRDDSDPWVAFDDGLMRRPEARRD